MQPIPKNILAQFDAMLKQRNIPVEAYNDYRKWLRYFLDFRAKHSPPDSRSDQVRLFVEKLRSKNQTMKQQEQAADAVSLFFALQLGDKAISSIAATTINLKRNIQGPRRSLSGSGLFRKSH